MKRIIIKCIAITLSFMMVLNLMPFTSLTMKVHAGTREIINNGLGGVWIDINGSTYKEPSNEHLGNSYTNLGCTWFVASRVEESTGINIGVHSGSNWWYSEYLKYNFTREEVPKEKSIICFAGDGKVNSYGYINTWGHVAIIEKIEGDIAYISEGGYRGGSDTNGYTRIFSCELSKIESEYKKSGNDLLGYVYFDKDVCIDTSFPDVNFRKYVSEHFDTNKDGKLNDEEISNATEIDIDTEEHVNIASFAGIEKLKYLRVFRYVFCTLEGRDIYPTEIDFTQNKQLGIIYVADSNGHANSIINIDVRNLEHLHTLDLRNCVNNIDITGCNYLSTLCLIECPITSVIGFEQVKNRINYLSIYDTNINVIDLGDMPSLINLTIGGENTKKIRLTSAENINYLGMVNTPSDLNLELGELLNLKKLDLAFDQYFKSVDLTNYPKLTSFEADWSTSLAKVKFDKNKKYENIHVQDTEWWSGILLHESKMLTPVIADASISFSNAANGVGWSKMKASLVCKGYSSSSSEESTFVWANKDRIKWSSSNPGVATIDNSGNIKVKNTGFTTVSATFYDTNLEEYRTFSAICDTSKSIFANKFVYIKCPVDVDIYDETGQLVGSVVNDELITESELIYLDVVGDMKVVGILDDQSYRFEMKGTDNGTLNVSIAEYEDDSLVKMTNFYDIPLSEGLELETEISGDELSQDENLEIRTEQYIYNVDEVLLESSLNTYCVTLQNSEGGTVETDDNYSKGEIASVRAFAEEGYVFEGWYDTSGNKVSEDESYYFEILDDITLKAEFAPEAEIEFELKKLVIDYDENVFGIGNAYACVLSAESEQYKVPETVTIIENGKILAEDSDYIYDNESGQVYIRNVQGNIKIVAEAILRSEVESIEITNIPESVVVGSVTQLNTEISGIGDYSNGVEWFVSGNMSKNTYITNDGKLVIGVDETAGRICIIAYSSEAENAGACEYILVEKRNVNNVQLESDKFSYADESIWEELRLLYDDNYLEYGKDFFCEFSEEIVGVGTYEITIFGIGSYYGEFERTIYVVETCDKYGHSPNDFVIENLVEATDLSEGMYDKVVYCGDCGKELSRRNVSIPKKIILLNDANVRLSKNNYSYNGKEIKPTVTVTLGSITLSEGTDYTIVYTNNRNIGTANVTIIGKGNYGGTVTLSFNILPKKITGFTYKSRTASTVTLKWTKNTSADGYVIQQYKGGKWTTIKTITKNSTVNYKVTGLKPSVNYKFRIRAYKNSGNTKLYSTSYTTKSVKTRPSTVKSFTYKSRTASTISLKWTKNTSADGYVIQQYKGGKWTTIKTITKNSTVSYKVTGLKPSTSYKFRIKAYKKDGSSKLYGTYSTKTVKTVPSTVKSFTYKSRTAKTITLKWTKNTSADGYVIQQYKGGKWKTIKTITSKSTVNYKVAGLKKNTTYKFRIKAYKKSGNTKLYGSYTTKSIKTIK